MSISQVVDIECIECHQLFTAFNNPHRSKPRLCRGCKRKLHKGRISKMRDTRPLDYDRYVQRSKARKMNIQTPEEDERDAWIKKNQLELLAKEQLELLVKNQRKQISAEEQALRDQKKLQRLQRQYENKQIQKKVRKIYKQIVQYPMYHVYSIYDFPKNGEIVPCAKCGKKHRSWGTGLCKSCYDSLT